MGRRLSGSEEALDTSRSPRQSRARRTNLAGLDFDPEEEDDEYNDDVDDSNVKAEEEDATEMAGGDEGADEEAEPEEEIIVVPPKKKRGRKRKIDIENEERARLENEGDGVKEETEGGDATEPEKKKGKKRGRKPKIPRPDDVFYDDKGNIIDVKNDEIVVEDEDPKGCAKIDENGFLQGDRKFKVKTFTLLGKGDRQYMVSTEPARLVGFRDSYLLFKTHHSLFKKVCTNDEKFDLILRHLIPTSYKGRAVNLVTARSIFREFGARMIVGGKKVTDDFWEDQARERGDVEGEPADIEEPAIKLPNPNGGDSSFLAQVTGTALVNYQTDPTWMYQVALQTLEYNKSLTELRNLVWMRGIKDSYSGLNFYPVSSQPLCSKVTRVIPRANDSKLGCSIRFVNKDIRRKITGLAQIPSHIFDQIEDEEIKKAIVEQQRYEESSTI